MGKPPRCHLLLPVTILLARAAAATERAPRLCARSAASYYPSPSLVPTQHGIPKPAKPSAGGPPPARVPSRPAWSLSPRIAPQRRRPPHPWLRPPPGPPAATTTTEQDFSNINLCYYSYIYVLLGDLVTHIVSVSICDVTIVFSIGTK